MPTPISFPPRSDSVTFTAGDAGVPAVTTVFGLVPDRVILLPEAMKLTGYSGTSLRRLEVEGKFPPRRQMGPFRAGWLLSDLTAWMHSLPHDRPESRDPAKRGRRRKAAAQQQQTAVKE